MEENSTLTEYERNLRKLYFVENVKRGLQNMEELNDALGRPLDSVSFFQMSITVISFFPFSSGIDMPFVPHEYMKHLLNSGRYFCNTCSWDEWKGISCFKNSQIT